ncbi:MAG: DUF2203 family protein [Gemmataceae bacterium]|nr:DUF2203 family protein [Gemmataceae bacterium]
MEILTLEIAEAMLPLAGRVAEDLKYFSAKVRTLRSERIFFEKKKREFTWRERRRQHEVTDELYFMELSLENILNELKAIGIEPLVAELGLIGFPTMVNNRRAYFSWKPGEPCVCYWNFADELNRRPVPPTWYQDAQVEDQKKLGA